MILQDLLGPRRNYITFTNVDAAMCIFIFIIFLEIYIVIHTVLLYVIGLNITYYML